jgi:methylase of polypeptide subunit release factors
VELVAAEPLPAALAAAATAFDIGTGTGVLAAVLARRGLKHVLATDLDPRALVCAHDNLERLGVAAQVALMEADLFPPGRAELIVCNPPWLPARPSSPIERGIYDPDSRMLRGFLGGLAAHLAPGGEGWLVLSDLAEHLQLRSREQLLAMFASAALEVIARSEAKPAHRKSAAVHDPLHHARAAEVTSLWRLRGAAAAAAA